MTSLNTGDVLHGRYRVVRTMGQGGFSVVYRAWDTVLGRPVALKENLESAAETQRQFLQEAKILANLTHPNLPRVTDFFLENQHQFLVMDFVDGQDLQAMLDDRQAPLPEAQALDWIAQICDALTYLHSQKPPIIHRDIKPGNIKITDQGLAVLVDFGIAKVYETQRKTTLGAQAITPGFSPFEQYGNSSTDARTDLYALGATLYALLTNTDPPESIQRVVRDPLVPARQYNADISLRTAAVLARALQMDPSQRYPTAAEFKAALPLNAAVRSAVPRQAVARPHIPPGGALYPAGGAPLTPIVRAAPPPRHAPPPQPVRPISYPLGGENRTSPGWLLAVIGLSVLVLALAGLLWRSAVTPPPGTPLALGSAPASLGDPGSAATLAAAVPLSPTLTATLSAYLQTRTPAATALPAEVITYTVQRGDTCSQLAQRFQINISAIARQNDLSADCGIIYAGQPLRIPLPAGMPTPDQATATLVAPEATRIAPADEMVQVYIPADKSLLGSPATDLTAGDEEKPQREVYVGAFWMDRYEVTNAQYVLCVADGDCQAPEKFSSKTRETYYGQAQYADYPVIYVSWQDASDYCAWADRRLPSEAEWEKAARGTDGRLYPWGQPPPSAAWLNFNAQVGDTSPVGHYPHGASPYGVLDMAGNVSEWVADWYNPAYYRLSSYSNPPGPASGDYRVMRGGSWLSTARAVRTAFRLWNYPYVRSETLGFRCAR